VSPAFTVSGEKKKEKVETTRTTLLPWHKQEMYKKKIDDMPSKSYYAE